MHLHSLQLQNTVEMQKHFQQSIFLQCRATWTELTYIKNITLTAGDTKASKSTNWQNLILSVLAHIFHLTFQEKFQFKKAYS